MRVQFIGNGVYLVGLGRWNVTGGTREDVPCGGEQAWEEPTEVISV